MKNVEKIIPAEMKINCKGKWFDLIVVNIVALFCVMLGFFTPFLSLAFAFLVFAYVQIGVYGFALESTRLNQPNFESIFFHPKYFLKIVCMKLVVMAGIMLWGLLLIVPGIIYALNCAFAGFIFFDEKDLSIRQILAKSKALTFGKRFEIFLIVMAMIAIVCLAASFGVGIYFLLSIWLKVPWFVTMILIMIPTIVVFVTVALPIFEFELAAAYERAKQQDEIAKNPKSNVKTKNATKKVSKSK